jgi:hypothetical protein
MDFLADENHELHLNLYYTPVVMMGFEVEHFEALISLVSSIQYVVPELAIAFEAVTLSVVYRQYYVLIRQQMIDEAGKAVVEKVVDIDPVHFGLKRHYPLRSLLA